MRLLWVCLLAVVTAHAQDAGFHLEGTGSRAVPVTGAKMTDIIFPGGIASAVWISRDIQVQRPKGVDNVIQLRAVRQGFRPTNLTVFGRDGGLCSFELHYAEDSAVLVYRVVRDGADVVRFKNLAVPPLVLDSDAVLLAGRRGWLHKRSSAGGLRLRVSGVYWRDSLLWLSGSVQNRAALPFIPGMMRVYLEDRKRVKRMASQEVYLLPVVPARVESLAGGASCVFAMGLQPIAVPKGKRLVVELTDDSGARDLRVKLKGKVVLTVRRR
jgi:hypothetical protein